MRDDHVPPVVAIPLPGGHLNLHQQILALIQERMEDLNMTQAELGRRIGWTPKHVNRIIGGYAEPSLAALDFIGHILGVRFSVISYRMEP